MCLFLCLNLRFLCENGGLVFISIRNKFASPYLLIWGLVGLDRVYITVCLVGRRLNLTSTSSKPTFCCIYVFQSHKRGGKYGKNTNIVELTLSKIDNNASHDFLSGELYQCCHARQQFFLSLPESRLLDSKCSQCGTV